MQNRILLFQRKFWKAHFYMYLFFLMKVAKKQGLIDINSGPMAQDQ